MPFTDAAAATHYPLRHNNLFNVLFCDGHVVPMKPEDLTVELFYVLR
jgi:prepilin-type processing-associated H-X9-DG protein